MKSLDGSLIRLGVDRIDLFQLHYPPKKGTTIEEFIDIMAETVKSGKVRAIGVSNLNAELMKRAYERLERHQIPLASNEVYYNLLERRAENNGVLSLCKTSNIALIPFSPMAQGLLTGKFRNSGNKVSFIQKVYFKIQDFDVFHEGATDKAFLQRLFHIPKANKVKKLEPLFTILEETAKKHNATITQVVLNWLLCTDPHILPIPGVKNIKQARDNIGALNFALSKDEYRKISQVNDQIE